MRSVWIAIVTLSLFLPMIGVPPTVQPASINDLPRGLHVGVPKQYGQDATNDAVYWLVGPYSCNSQRTFYDWAPEEYPPHVYQWSCPFIKTPMVWSALDNGLQAYANAAAQGDTRLWLIENEPNGGGQSPSTPAQVRNAVLNTIGGTGQKFACCGLLLFDLDWDTWLKSYLQWTGWGQPYCGACVPDYWHIHIYKLWDGYYEFDTQLDDFTDTLAAMGIPDRPIIVSELGCITQYCTHQDQIGVMEDALDALADGRIHSAYWFSSYYGPNWQHTNLLECRNAQCGPENIPGYGVHVYHRTALGNHYVEHRDDWK